MKVKLSSLKRVLKQKIQEALSSNTVDREKHEKRKGVAKHLPGEHPKELGGEKAWGDENPFEKEDPNNPNDYDQDIWGRTLPKKTEETEKEGYNNYYSDEEEDDPALAMKRAAMNKPQQQQQPTQSPMAKKETLPQKQEGGWSRDKRGLERGYEEEREEAESELGYRIPGHKEKVEEGEEIEEGGWKRVKRATGKGYREEGSELAGDYKPTGEFAKNETAMPKLSEIAPEVNEAANSEKAEEFVKKNKADFKKRYGARWEEVLYSTANKKFPSKK